MNLPGKSRSHSRLEHLVSQCGSILLGSLLVTLISGSSLQADTTVQTLGGGRLTPEGSDAGFTDGAALQVSQFHTPYGCALDTAGHLYVADRDNGALRELDLDANRCRTVLRSLSRPVAVAIDRTNLVYVLSQGDGTIQRISRGLVTILTSQLSAPTAMAYDGTSSLFVAQNNGQVVKVSLANGSVSAPVLSGLNQPSGIAVLDSGFLAVSEAGANWVRVWDPTNGSLKLQVGSGLAGFAEGLPDRAQFQQPGQLAKAPGGSLVLVDRGNQRVRLIDFDGFVTTVYGVDPATWEGPACTSCPSMILPGWLDGSAEFAEARDPAGVTVSSDGTIYTTETFYHVVRQVSGAAFTAAGEVAPPVIFPSSGYYPTGQTITVVDGNASSLLPTAIYYTTDGSEPTTNSLRVPTTAGVGSIFWQEKRTDLTSLRLKAFLGNKASTVVAGEPVNATEIGVTQDFAAGIGSTAIVPIIVNLRTNQQLKSLQFRVEVTPATPAGVMIPEIFGALEVSTNDFIPVVTAAQGQNNALMRVASYSSEATRSRGLAIAYIGAEANMVAEGFAVVAMLAIPIPPTAQNNDRYTISVLNPSGTMDGAQQRLEIAPMPARTLVVTGAKYLVGDSSPATWYNAGYLHPSGALQRGFGDGILDNSDVNNAFSAALGYAMPFAHTDLFDAMDVFPEDTAESAGGDGLIRFLDWQILLSRSLGMDLARWERNWSDGGIRVPAAPGEASTADTPGQTLTAPLAGAVWTPQIALQAETVTDATPGMAVDVPVRVQVTPGCELAGLAFRAVLQPDGTAPPVEQPLQFRASPILPAPAQNLAPSPETILCGWPLVPSSSFDPPLQGSNLLGYVRVVVPAVAKAGQSYTLRFARADGSPDLQTQYNFETRPSSIWVLSPALRPSDSISDEWKVRFFGSVLSEAAAPELDPDQDGVSNQAEYLAGTDPTDPRSCLHLEGAALDVHTRHVVLRWLSAPGKNYTIEAAANVWGSNWTTVASNLPGNGGWQESIQTNLTSNTQFYRIRLQP